MNRIKKEYIKRVKDIEKNFNTQYVSIGDSDGIFDLKMQISSCFLEFKDEHGYFCLSLSEIIKNLRRVNKKDTSYHF